MDFSELEAAEGLRWTWHAWPSHRKAADKLLVPLAIMCCPLFSHRDSAAAAAALEIPRLPYPPLRCSSCAGVLNPYARLDPPGKQRSAWTCPFCFHRNALPLSHHHHHHHLSSSADDVLPPELFPAHTCVEYILPSPAARPYAVSYPYKQQQQQQQQQQQHSVAPAAGPAFLFVVDKCIPAQDLGALKKSISHTIALLPDNAVIGLVSFAAQVHVHDFGSMKHYTKALVFDCDRECTTARIQELLSINSRSQRPMSIKQGGINRFLVQTADNEFNFLTVLDELQSEIGNTDAMHRPQRATGVALSIAVSLLEGWSNSSGSRILLFVGGPATVGQGKVVGMDLEESMRSHRDIRNHRAYHSQKAETFYKGIQDALVSKSLVLDVFACSLDQVGVHEMKSAIEASGGLLVLAESFQADEFGEALQRIFTSDNEDGLLKMCFNATLELIASPKVKVTRALGPCSPLDNNQGGTSTWKLCTLTEKTNLAFLFEVSNQPVVGAQPGTAFVIQFITKYHKADGQARVRVMTTARRWIDESQLQELKAGFDQEAAAAIIARIAIQKASEQDPLDVITWLENTLIRFAAKYGDYHQEVAESFQLSSGFSLFPQLVFYLRRSPFLQVSNNTPDETAFFRLMLNREGVAETVVMIQPTLLSYSFDGPPRPVLLDVSSIKPNTILLFDAFFVVVVHCGSMIAQWRKLNYHGDPSYDNFKKLLEAPIMDAQMLLAERNPPPKFIQCDQHSSQARFLLARLNPSVTHRSESVGESDMIFTDDMSLQVFIDHLQELAVKDGYI